MNDYSYKENPTFLYMTTSREIHNTLEGKEMKDILVEAVAMETAFAVVFVVVALVVNVIDWVL